jgi:hypothetical protein
MISTMTTIHVDLEALQNLIAELGNVEEQMYEVIIRLTNAYLHFEVTYTGSQHQEIADAFQTMIDHFSQATEGDRRLLFDRLLRLQGALEQADYLGGDIDRARLPANGNDSPSAGVQSPRL